MDFRIMKLEYSDFGEREKEIYRYMLMEFDKQTDSSDIYGYNKELNVDFVTLTDETILEDTAERFGLTVNEIDLIHRKIEISMAD